MYLARVVGTCVATRKVPDLAGEKLLVVQPLDAEQHPKGTHQVAVDTVRAGLGELVFLVGAREAAQALDRPFVPVDAAIVGIVDDIA